MIEWSLKETNCAHNWSSKDQFHEKHKNKSMSISIKTITFPSFFESNQELQSKPQLFSQQESVVYFPLFTYTFHYFLSTPQIKARSSLTCILPIFIFHFHLSFPFSFSYHFRFANKPCFNENYWIRSPLSLKSLQKHLDACMT